MPSKLLPILLSSNSFGVSVTTGDGIYRKWKNKVLINNQMNLKKLGWMVENK